MTPIAALTPDHAAMPSATAGAGASTIEIVAGLAAAESLWRAFEREIEPSPYSRFDWVEAFASAGGSGAEIKVALVRDGSGRPALLLPVALGRRFGLRLASHVGGKHANLVMPLARRSFLRQLGPGGATSLLRDIGRALRADALTLGNVPALWQGEPNPFAAGRAPSASPAYRLDLAADGETTLGRSMSRDARKKLRSKERGLAGLGPVDLLLARNEADIDLILAAFRDQKTQRFAELGIADPFADAAVQAAIRAASVKQLPGGAPALELYGLRVGGRVVAVLGGAASVDRLSGMFLSFEQGEAARYSPGEILVTRVIAAQCARGRKVFDLGVGDARYKRQICDGIEELVDVVVPVSAAGRLYAAASGQILDIKRRLKADPRAMALLAAARKRLRPASRA